MYSKSARVKIIAEDVESREVTVDIAISALAGEILISDLLAGEIEIAVEDFAWVMEVQMEPKEEARRSEPPQVWR